MPAAVALGGWLYTRAQAGKEVRAEQTLRRAEQSVAAGNAPLAQTDLEKLATGLGGKLVYAIVPPPGKTFEQLVIDRAENIARKRVARVSHTMSLEDQGVEKKHEEKQLRRVVESLLAGSRRILWR